MGANKCFNCGEYPRYEFETKAEEIVIDENNDPCPHGIIHYSQTCPFRRTYWHHTRKLAEEKWNRENNWEHQKGEA